MQPQEQGPWADPVLSPPVARAKPAQPLPARQHRCPVQAYVLLLEDLRPNTTIGSRINDTPVANVGMALRTVAKLHARYYGGPTKLYQGPHDVDYPTVRASPLPRCAASSPLLPELPGRLRDARRTVSKRALPATHRLCR